MQPIINGICQNKKQASMFRLHYLERAEYSLSIDEMSFLCARSWVLQIKSIYILWTGTYIYNLVFVLFIWDDERSASVKEDHILGFKLIMVYRFDQFYFCDMTLHNHTSPWFSMVRWRNFNQNYPVNCFCHSEIVLHSASVGNLIFF